MKGKKGYWNIVSYLLLCSIGVYSGLCYFEFAYDEYNPRDNILWVDSMPKTKICEYSCCVEKTIDENLSVMECQGHGINHNPICPANTTKQCNAFYWD